MAEIRDIPDGDRKSKSASKEEKKKVTAALRLQALDRATYDFNGAAVAFTGAALKLLMARSAYETKINSPSSSDQIPSVLELKLRLEKCQNEFNAADKEFEKLRAKLFEALDTFMESHNKK